jgi:hypothetical protein
MISDVIFYDAFQRIMNTPKISILWNVTPYNLVEIFQRYGQIPYFFFRVRAILTGPCNKESNIRVNFDIFLQQLGLLLDFLFIKPCLYA